MYSQVSANDGNFQVYCNEGDSSLDFSSSSTSSRTHSQGDGPALKSSMKNSHKGSTHKDSTSSSESQRKKSRQLSDNSIAAIYAPYLNALFGQVNAGFTISFLFHFLLLNRNSSKDNVRPKWGTLVFEKYHYRGLRHFFVQQNFIGIDKLLPLAKRCKLILPACKADEVLQQFTMCSTNMYVYVPIRRSVLPCIID